MFELEESGNADLVIFGGGAGSGVSAGGSGAVEGHSLLVTQTELRK